MKMDAPRMCVSESLRQSYDCNRLDFLIVGGAYNNGGCSHFHLGFQRLMPLQNIAPGIQGFCNFWYVERGGIKKSLDLKHVAPP